MIAPLVDELAGEYAGKVTCVKINTDESPQVATEYGVRSIPTVMVRCGAGLWCMGVVVGWACRGVAVVHAWGWGGQEGMSLWCMGLAMVHAAHAWGSGRAGLLLLWRRSRRSSMQQHAAVVTKKRCG